MSEIMRNEWDINNIYVHNIILYDNSEGGLVYGRARVVIKDIFLWILRT